MKSASMHQVFQLQTSLWMALDQILLGETFDKHYCSIKYY